MKFKVDERVFQVLPDACFGVVIAKGCDNARRYPQLDAMLDASIADAEKRFSGVNVKEAPAILPYREAFLRLSINPNKFMSSIEAIVTRVSKNKGFVHINPIVDLGNALSLKYILPMGAHDIGQMDADIEVRFSRAGDTFLPFGETEVEEMPENELIYAVGDKVRTRRWIWRQSELGKIGPNTRDVFFPIDGFSGVNGAAVMAARNELAALMREVFGIDDVRMEYIDINHREIEL